MLRHSSAGQWRYDSYRTQVEQQRIHNRLNENAEVVASKFFDQFYPTTKSILFKNLFEESRYILADCMNNHYHAIEFDDNLEITNYYTSPINELLEQELDLSYKRLFLTPEGEIVMGTRTKSPDVSASAMVFAKLDIYGKILSIKYTSLSYSDYSYVSFPFLCMTSNRISKVAYCTIRYWAWRCIQETFPL